MTSGVAAVLAAATGAGTERTDGTSQRILDAAVLEAAAVGLQRITVEDVVRRAGVARMTAYRRFPRRDDLVEALVQRETQRFLAAVAEGIGEAEGAHDGVARAFIAAVRFARDHPMLRRAAQTDSALPPEDTAALLRVGSEFIADYLRRNRRSRDSASGAVDQRIGWVADMFARLFLTYVATPPGRGDFGPDLADDVELRRFAHEVLTPMVEGLG